MRDNSEKGRSKIKKSSLSFLLASFFLTACSVEQPRFEVSSASARAAYARGEVKEALAFFESQAQEAEKNAASSSSPQRYWEAASKAYIQAQRAARLSGQLQKSIVDATKALETAEKTNNPVFRVDANYRLIYAYRAVRNFEKAREFIDKGFELVKQLPPSTNARIDREGLLYLELGRDLSRRRDYQKAIEAFSQSLYFRRAVLADLSRRPGLYQEFREESYTDMILALNGLGTAYRLAGQQEQALEQYQQARNSIQEWGLKYPYEADLYQSMAEIYLRQKNYPQALENFQNALALAESQRYPASISSASRRIGDILRQTGKPLDAIPYYQKAIQQAESTRSLIQSEELRQSYFEGALNAYVSMIDTLLAAGKLEEAFDYSERARSRIFLDILGSRVQLSKVTGGLLEEERALNGRLASLKARLAGVEGDGERAGLQSELREAERAYNAFLAKVRKENKEQASLMNVEPLTLKQVQELLDPGVTVLEYFVVQQGVLLWVVDKDRLRFVNIPISRTDLVSKVSSLRETIYNINEKEKFTGLSQELYRRLIEPALPHIRGKELLVIPHDVLHYLPYQALLSSQGKYLIQDYPLYYLSSASLMQFTREKRRASREKALVMGNPNLGGDPAYNLRFAGREAKEVARIFPKSAVYVEAEATKPRAISLSPNYDILHFAVHAELKEDDPLGSALLLVGEGKEDGRLTVGEIFSLNLKADMVVLSACETGLGKVTNGDEIIGLTRAFIYAGTPSVVTTLWKVNDQASYELMREFYTDLKTRRKSEALRQAQLKTMQDFPEPFFWAAYALTGEP